MALFGTRYGPGAEGPSISNARSVTGRPVTPPEAPGSFERRSRLFGEAIRIADSQANLSTEVAALFARESSLVKWVSLRGALTFLAIALEDPSYSLSQMRAFAGHAEPNGLEVLLRSYPNIEKASFKDVLADTSLTRNNDWHLGLIEWCASAFSNGQLHKTLLSGEIPAAQELTTPGWYAEPVFAKCERYWDGGDWTNRCRILEGRKWESFSSAF